MYNILERAGCFPSMLTASQCRDLLWSASFPVYVSLLEDINLVSSCCGGCSTESLVKLRSPMYHRIQAAGRLGFVVQVMSCVSPNMTRKVESEPPGIKYADVTRAKIENNCFYICTWSIKLI